MVPVLIGVAFVVLVGLLAWRGRHQMAGRRCCQSGPWPPEDLVGSEPTGVPSRPAPSDTA